ncbi:MAG TPA: S41 family peptidase [Candidatus Bathyarchaeia archaeon]|nr:S41 family peptidase [Candidatus Bathyarchaeia archaeon]
MSNNQELEAWDNSIEQKMWILMQVWAEVKFNFAFFDQVPELNWEKETRSAIPKILATKNIGEYYQILQELVALLNDGHTLILPSKEEMDTLDRPALELQMIENKIIITRIGDSEEIMGNKIIPGLEIIEINNVSAKDYLNNNILRYYSGGTKHWGEAFGLFRFLEGPKNSKMTIKLKDLDGKIRTVKLTRNSEMKNGENFKYNIFNYYPLVEKKIIDEEIIYFKLSTFMSEQIVEDFNKELDLLDLNKIKGMILDIRSNMGGNSDNGFNIISRLIDKPIEAAKWKTRKYLPAYRSWGNPEEWFEDSMGMIQPSTEKTYLGPLILLTGNTTFSSAEDFVVPLKFSKRAKIIGEITGGSTGNPVTIILPGGYIFRICSKRDEFPDGTEFVGFGIQPDIQVKLTQNDISENKDVILEKAIEEINDWDKGN